jgi:drug/metabolite transporter (DMT)-like permease
MQQRGEHHHPRHCHHLVIFQLHTLLDLTDTPPSASVGMNCMKHAHNINTDEFGDPIKHFAKIPWWWGGVLGIVGGEVANIVAYGYAPASIVTPMGAVGVLTNVVITSYALGEAFRPLQGVGIACVVAGIVLVVYYAPVTFIPIVSDTIWGDWMWTKEFAAYVGTFAFLVPASLMMSKKWGERSVVFYLLTCASISSLTIVSAKTFSTLLAAGIEKGFETEWLAPAPYVALFLMIVTAVLSMNFVNKAMMKFGNSLVVPTYYAFFTTFSVGSVAWVYREFDCLTSPLQIGLFLFGVVMTVSGVALLQVGAPSHPSDGDDDHNTSQNQVPLGVPFINSLDHSTSSTGTNHGGKYSAIWGSSFTGAALHYSVDKHHRRSAGGHGGKSFTRDGASLQGSMQTRLTMEAGLLSVCPTKIDHTRMHAHSLTHSLTHSL